MPKVTELVNYGARIQTQAVAPESEFLTPAQVLDLFQNLDPRAAEDTWQAC